MGETRGRMKVAIRHYRWRLVFDKTDGSWYSMWRMEVCIRCDGWKFLFDVTDETWYSTWWMKLGIRRDGLNLVFDVTDGSWYSAPWKTFRELNEKIYTGKKKKKKLVKWKAVNGVKNIQVLRAFFIIWCLAYSERADKKSQTWKP